MTTKGNPTPVREAAVEGLALDPVALEAAAVLALDPVALEEAAVQALEMVVPILEPVLAATGSPGADPSAVTVGL